MPLATGRSVFDLSVSGGSGDLKGAGGRGKTKTKNKGGPGAQGLQTAPRRGPKEESWGRGLQTAPRRGPKGESWGILEDHAWWTTCMVDHMHGGPSMVAEAILELNFQRKCASWGPPCIKNLPSAHCKRLVTVRKRFVFVFFLGGPAPPGGRGGALTERSKTLRPGRERRKAGARARDTGRRRRQAEARTGQAQQLQALVKLLPGRARARARPAGGRR